MAKRNWDSIGVYCRTMASNFSSMDCTHKQEKIIKPEDLGEPEQVLAKLGADYYTVFLDHYEGDDVFIRVKSKVYKVEPGLRIEIEEGLSYAYAYTYVIVKPTK